jgi:hypothetical protein
LVRHLNHLPIWRDANRLLLAIEQAVRVFPRYHKYTLGSELRRQAMQVCRLIMRAADQRDDPLRWLQQLVMAVDDLKLSVQLAEELEAFRSFKEFHAVAELAVAVGKQSGGWRKRSAGANGQNRPVA